MTFSWFDIVVLFGVIQGLVSAILLIKNRKNAIGSKLLAALLFVFSLLSFKIALHTLGLWDTKTFRYFPLAIDLLIQPLLYFYVCSLIIPDFRISGKKILHLFPPLIFFVHAILVYFAVIQKTDLHVKDVIAEKWHFNAIKTFEDDLSVFSTIIYGWLSFRLVQGYRKWLYNHIAGTNYQTFGWLKNVLSFTGILGLGLLINICLDQVFYFSNHHFLHWQVFYIYLSFLIYYIAYRSYQK
ncbi:MAG: AraC family transcriptional regulator [Mucilaginibacter sp.]|nr:AraC family transcriptional regulator [Mucilaginibacter sp.]